MTDDVDLPPPVWVDTPSGLIELATDLIMQSVVAVDTESNSLHAYREQVCLIQFSTLFTDYIVNPLALPELSILGQIFASNSIQKVFHAAEYDMVCLKRDFGWQVNNLFDTMVAVRTLGWPQNGLASVLETRFGIKLNKRYQRANWGERPLTPEQLAYARLDTHYLLPLRDHLASELHAADRWEEALEEFDRLSHVNGRVGPSKFDPQNFWYISGARDLTLREAAILRELYVYREQSAQRLNRPPFKVMSDGTLLELAKSQPHSLPELKTVVGMTPNQINRHGQHILQAVLRGQKAPVPGPLHVEHEDDEVIDRYEALRRWRKQRAQERGVESDVIVPRDVLLEIARRAPQLLAELEDIPGLGPTRRAKYGAEIIRVLKPG